MNKNISWYDFSFWGNEKVYVNDALDSTWLSGGEYINNFERELCKSLNLPNAFVVANGTAALQLSFLVLGIKPGDEVIVPAFGFLAAANVLKLMHAVPIFVDVDEHHWCISSSRIEEKITAKTKAILVIHNYGVVEEIYKISAIAKKYNLPLIEDCAESIFSQYDNKYCGSFGDISTFSFHATKTISTGEGGMVSCKDESLIDKLKLIRSHGLRREKKHYWHEYYGNNFRLSNILAAIGLGQLEKSKVITEQKDRIYSRYMSNLEMCSALGFQSYSKRSNPLIWAVTVFLDSKNIRVSRDEILQKFLDNKIECRPGFYTPDQLDIYRTTISENYPVANRIASNTIVLPSYPSLTNEKIDYICKVLKEVIGE